MRSVVEYTVLIGSLVLWPLIAGATPTREAVVAVKAPGAANVFYQTDVVLSNLGFGDASCDLTLLHPTSAAVAAVTVPEDDGVLVVEDAFDFLAPGDTGSGGLLVECTTAVGVTSRTFAKDGTDGTDQAGQSIHGFGLDEQLSPINAKRILGVSQNSSYRTNVTFINAGSIGVTVTITREADGATAGTLVNAGSMVQVNSALQSLFGVSDSVNEALGFTVASGDSILVMGTIVNNTSNDFATLAAIPADGVAGPLVLPAFKESNVATDLDLFNPGLSAESVSLTFSNGATTAILVDPGPTSLPDVLAALGVSSGTGALEITATNPLLAQARYVGSGPDLFLAALPAQPDVAPSFVQRLGTCPGVTSATTIVSSRGNAEGYMTMTPPGSPQPSPAGVSTYSIGASQAATIDWAVAPSVGGSVAEFTTDNFSGVVSALISSRNQHDIMVTPFHISEVPRPFIQQTGYSCTPGTAVFTAFPDWPGLTWEWFADGLTTGLTTRSIDAAPGVGYHVVVTDPVFVDPGRSRVATVIPPFFCDDFESGDLLGWD